MPLRSCGEATEKRTEAGKQSGFANFTPDRPCCFQQQGLGAVQAQRILARANTELLTMIKLTDTQLIVLSSAAKHDEGLATRPSNLNPSAAMKVASSLIDKGFAREIRAKADAPVWHENEDGRFALKITKAGREAIGADDEVQGAMPSSATPPLPAKTKSAGSKPGANRDAQKSPAAPTKRAPADKTATGADVSSPTQIRAGSKQARIIDLMSRPKGATLSELIEATDWLPHTTRAALTRLRKRGLFLERVKDEGRGSVYRIKEDRTAAKAA